MTVLIMLYCFCFPHVSVNSLTPYTVVFLTQYLSLWEQKRGRYSEGSKLYLPLVEQLPWYAH